VEVWNGQQLGLTLGQPLGASQALAFGTMPVATGIIGLPHEAAVDAVFRVPTQGGSPASFNRSHDPALNASEMALVLMAIISPVTVEYIRHFQIRTHGARLSRAA
jgi:hypothetical protein